jgi:hypothetical protein
MNHNKIKIVVRILFFDLLIHVSVKGTNLEQYYRMMNSECCNEEAVLCLTRASESSNSEIKTRWLEMAGQWHDLAGDNSAQATTARLMANARAAL